MSARRKPREKAARLRFGAYEFKKKGVSRFDLRDPYHLAIALTWPQFLAALFALYLFVNTVFATLFWLVPGSVANARSGRFTDVLFFSIETLATVGYGDMYPATLYGHVVASSEILCGLAFTAILTGLTFVRFSRSASARNRAGRSGRTCENRRSRTRHPALAPPVRRCRFRRQKLHQRVLRELGQAQLGKVHIHT
jgi:inward rectifier potassium channel